MATAGGGSKFLRRTLEHLATDGVEITDTPVDVGLFGTVVEGKWMGAPCAIKRLRTEDATEYLSDRFLCECSLWSELKHPNVLQFYGVHFPMEGAYPVIVTELLQHNLDQYLSTLRREAFPLITKAYILRDVTLAVRYLHSRKPAIILRDLSASFVYLTPALTAKLGEFGTASKLENEGRGGRSSSASLPVTGSNRWPEPYSSFASDAFSFGSLVLHTILHTFPEPDAKIKLGSGKGDKGEVVRELQRRDKYLKQLTAAEKNFQPILAQCFTDDPKGRPAFAQLCTSMELIITHLNGAKASSRRNARDVLQLQAQLRNKEEELRTSRQALTRMQMSVSSILIGKEYPESPYAPPLPGKPLQSSSRDQLHRISKLSLKDEGYQTMSPGNSVRMSTGSEDSDIEDRPPSRSLQGGKPWDRSSSVHQSRSNGISPGGRKIGSPESHARNGLVKGAPKSPVLPNSASVRGAPTERETSPHSVKEPPFYTSKSSPPPPPERRQLSVYDTPSSAGRAHKTDGAKTPPPPPPPKKSHRFGSMSLPVNASPSHFRPDLRVSSTSPSSSDTGSPPPSTNAVVRKDYKDLHRGEKVVVYPDAWDRNGDSCMVQSEHMEECVHVQPASKYLEEVRPIGEEIWFTQMQREDAELHMQKAINPVGSYFVRKGRNGYVLAVKNAGRACSYQIFHTADDMYALNPEGTPNFVTISELVREYTKKKLGLVTLLTLPFISQRMELSRESFTMDEEVHQGKRFVVWSGMFAGLTGAPATPVSVKTISQDEDQRKANTAALHNEASILNLVSRSGGHQNILKMFGVCAWSEQPHIVVESCFKLNLQRIVRQHSELYTSQHLSQFATHIASAMAFLEEKDIVHRELKAANVLVSQGADCKLSGFHRAITTAKAQETFVAKEYAMVSNPRWTAPEVYTADAQYTSKSDVWSFGMLLVELFTHGCEPYYQVTNLIEVKSMVSNNTPPDIPNNCPLNMHSCIQSCLQMGQSQRPSFAILEEQLRLS